MKYRTGFVSNSSSSSFVIALKSSDSKCPTCGRKDMDLLDMIEKSANNNADNGVVRGKKDTIKALEVFYVEDTEKRKNLLNNLDTYEKEGYDIAFIDVSYHDEVIRNEMDALEKSEKMVVLYRSEE